jgi:uncharacterized membrane protein
MEIIHYCILYYIIGLVTMALWAYYQGDEVDWQDVAWGMFLALIWPWMMIIFIVSIIRDALAPWWGRVKRKVIWKGRDIS